MELETGTRAIVALAWARRLGFEDSALHYAAMGDTAPRIVRADESGNVVFLRLLRGSALVGPEWLLDAAEAYDDEALASESTLVRLASGHGGGRDVRSRGETVLYYLDEALDVVPSESTLVSQDPAHARALEAECPRDDAAEVHLSRREHSYTLLTQEGHTAIAGAGYDLWEGMIADVSALTLPSLRRHGLGSYIAAIAVDEALTQGLVPQWRADVSNRAANQTAESIGFLLTGSLTEVRLH